MHKVQAQQLKAKINKKKISIAFFAVIAVTIVLLAFLLIFASDQPFLSIPLIIPFLIMIISIINDLHDIKVLKLYYNIEIKKAEEENE